MVYLTPFELPLLIAKSRDCFFLPSFAYRCDIILASKDAKFGQPEINARIEPQKRNSKTSAK